MAPNDIRTNNINLLMPEGQFGSRLEGGKDSAAPRYIFTYLSKITSIMFNKDDTPLLKQNVDDGDLVEPVFYMPIMPIILVNGTNGIGTGWATNIPQFNPTDIIANIRRLLKGDDIVPMNPWYRGFTGSIRRIAPNKWVTKGRYKVIDNSTLEISELPIGYWTSDFKELLDSYEKGYKIDAPASTKGTDKKKRGSASASASSTSSKKPKWAEFGDDEGRLIKSYKNESSEANIKFTLKFEPNIMNNLLSDTDKAGLTEFEKIFHLTTSISCVNSMNLYDENNKLKNFTSPEAILQYYFDKRLEYYKLRRQYLIKVLEDDLFLLSTRARFILDVIADVVKVRNVPKADVIKNLEKLKYPKMVEGSLMDLDKMTPAQREDATYGSYDFLVSMPIYNLTKEKVDDLLKEKEKRSEELALLKSKTDKDIWEEDLKTFEGEYKKHMDEYYEYMGIDPKEMKNNAIKGDMKKVVMKKK